jgi:hypothetical protein
VTLWQKKQLFHGKKSQLFGDKIKTTINLRILLICFTPKSVSL